MEYFLAVLYGIVFGVANIIPGVSGGTMLVVFGCYDKVCGALTLNLKEIKKNIVFLIFFGIGAVLGIVGFSFVITWLFDRFPTQTYMMFIGLIIGSVPLIIRNATVKEKFRPVCVVPFIAALALVIGLAVAEQAGTSEPYSITTSVSGDRTYVTVENNSDRNIKDWNIEIKNGGFDTIWTYDSVPIEGAQITLKVGTLQKLLGTGAQEGAMANLINGEGNSTTIPPRGKVAFNYDNRGAHFSESDMKLSVMYSMDIGFFALLLITSVIAAVAMIIPGVSGSFMMVLFGTYSTIIGAIKGLEILTLIPVALGVVIGVVAGARIITALLRRHRLIVFSAILGLVAGSLYAILPAGFGLNIETLFGFIALAAGAATAFIVGKKTKVEG